MLKIGITGVNGFVGSSLYIYLKKQHYDVVGFSRRKSDREFTYWDISKGTLETPVQVDILIHCAGTVDDWTPYKECYVNNCIGTENALNTFPALQKFIYISSCSVYDTEDLNYSIDETSSCGNYLNGYSQSKYEAEQTVLNHASKSQKIILRPHVIYGAMDKKIIPRLLRAHRFNRFIILGKGSNTISITHIDNLCLAIKDSIETEEEFKSEIFNVADMEPVKINILMNHVKKKFNIQAKNFYVPKKIAFLMGSTFEEVFRLLRIKKAPFISKYIVHQMTSDHFISINKAKNMLKYNPTKSFVDF